MIMILTTSMIFRSITFEIFAFMILILVQTTILTLLSIISVFIMSALMMSKHNLGIDLVMMIIVVMIIRFSDDGRRMRSAGPRNRHAARIGP